MKLTGKKTRIFLVILILIFPGIKQLSAQASPEILQTGTLEEQLDYIQNRTIIYENFRAIREDMFQRIKNNSLDSLNHVKNQMQELSMQLLSQDNEMDSLSVLLDQARNELNMAIKNRDNIVFLGIPMNKTGYNMLVWLIIGGLAALLLIGLVIYQKNRIITSNSLNEIEELKTDFETYKKNSREQREKLVMDHFNEIKKYKERIN